MKCILFGSTGYIGKHLHAYLANNGWKVIVPRNRNGDQIDLRNIKLVEKIDWNVDVVFMFAGRTGTLSAFDDHENYILANELALLNVLGSIRSSLFRPRVVFPSSRLIYEGSLSPISEDGALQFKTIYAVNKLACEKYLEVYQRVYDISYTILRICVPYGNQIGQEYSYGTIGGFINQARNRGKIRIYGDGKLMRSFTHIEDICRFVESISLHKGGANKKFNLPGESFSLMNVAMLVGNALGVSVENVDWPEKDAKIESGSTVFDAKKILDLLSISTIHRFSNWVEFLKQKSC